MAIDVSKVSILMKLEQTSTDQAILFVFIDNRTTPEIVVKVAMGEWEDVYLDREIETLKNLEQRFTHITNIPKIVFEGCYGGYRTQAQTFIDGLPLTKAVSLNNLDLVANTVTDWLVSLAKQTSNSAPFNWSNYLVKDVLNDLTPSITTRNAPELLAVTAQSLENLNLVNQVVQHRDSGPLEYSY